MSTAMDDITSIAERIDQCEIVYIDAGSQVRLGTHAAGQDDPTVRMRIGDAETDAEDLGVAWVQPDTALRIARELTRLADEVTEVRHAYARARADAALRKSPS